MKKIISWLLLSFVLAACDTWGAPPQPFPVWTPIPSQTPSIVTATPLILLPPSIVTTVATITQLVPISPTNTETPSPTNTLETVTPTQTFTPSPVQSVLVDILGCNTSLDIRNGMGEVTNAYVTIKNNGTVDLPNTCALLRAVDEDREHPDKKRCVELLPAQSQVNLKLTVDSQYKVDTIIQVDITTNDTILKRLDQESCKDIGLFGGEPSDIGVIKPIQP